MDKKLEIIIGKNAGFCYGVNNAVTKTMKILKSNEDIKKEVYCLGELVHNGEVIKKLERSGLSVIEVAEDLDNKKSINDTNEIKVIIRAHGVSLKIYQELEKRNCEIIDLTCPKVLSIHKIAQDFSKQGYYIFIIGKKKHPEVIGTYGFCKEASIIEKEEDIENSISQLIKNNKRKLLILAQTTFSLTMFNQFVDIIQKQINIEEVIIKNTICNATKVRQEETEELSKQVDYMIIVGGKNSSNTKKLYEIAKQNCKATICVETAKELSIQKIKNIVEENNLKSGTKVKFKIGVMAGASTPKESIEEVKNAVNSL